MGHTTEHPDGNPMNITGTEITFFPDKEIFTALLPEEFEFDYDYIAARLRDLAYLNPIEIEFIDQREGKRPSDHAPVAVTLDIEPLGAGTEGADF